MANQTATDYGIYPPRAVHNATNRMHTNMITTISASASDNMYMFLIPSDCMVIGGGIKASVPSGTSGNVVLKIGYGASDAAFGTYTVSGTAVLSTKFSTMISPVTVSSSGTDAPQPCIVVCNSAATSTTSVSIYLILEYVMPGKIN